MKIPVYQYKKSLISFLFNMINIEVGIFHRCMVIDFIFIYFKKPISITTMMVFITVLINRKPFSSVQNTPPFSE